MGNGLSWSSQLLVLAVASRETLTHPRSSRSYSGLSGTHFPFVALFSSKAFLKATYLSWMVYRGFSCRPRAGNELLQISAFSSCDLLLHRSDHLSLKAQSGFSWGYEDGHGLPRSGRNSIAALLPGHRVTLSSSCHLQNTHYRPRLGLSKGEEPKSNPLCRYVPSSSCFSTCIIL